MAEVGPPVEQCGACGEFVRRDPAPLDRPGWGMANHLGDRNGWWGRCSGYAPVTKQER